MTEADPPRAATTDESTTTPPPGRRGRRVARGLLLLLLVLTLGELATRVFWVARGAAFLTAHRTIYRSFYPEVAQAERRLADDEQPATGRAPVDVLLLGGSVLDNDYGDVEHLIRERLSRQRDAGVRVHNLARPGHTSLDSFYKYRHLGSQHFDLIVVYHGINELRANNCPTGAFREDYSHFSWYALINALERWRERRWFTLPYTARFLTTKVLDRLGWSDRLPTHRPGPASLDYGCDIKTAGAFEHNLRRILELAGTKGEPVMLMTFAWYLPDNYTEDAFRAGRLDYTAHAFPVELWGKARCVAAGLSAHNAVIVALARRFPGTLLVDQNKLMPKQGVYFNDICHLTHEGCERFVADMMKAMDPLRPAPPGGSGDRRDRD